MISVIIPLYNKEKSISSTIESVLSQTYKNFELIIINDGSTDKSGEIIRKYLNDPRIKYYYKTNSGVSSTRNYGIKVAKGEWILFLDADDELSVKALESLSKFTEYNVDIICGTYVIASNSNIIKRNRVKEGFINNNYKNYFLKEINLRMGVALLRKSLLLENPFDETLSRYEDLKAILSWMRKAKIYSTNESVMIYRTEFCQLSKILTSIDVNKDFTFHLDFKNKVFWEKCILGELLYLSFIGYKNKRLLLIKKYKQNILFALIAKINFILQKIKLCLVK